MEGTSRVTLHKLASLAAGLHRLRYFFAGIALAAGIWFGYQIVTPVVDSSLSLLALTALLWSALALAMGATLALEPARVEPSDGFLARVRKRLLLAGYGLAALVLFCLALFTLWLSVRAVGMVIAA